MASSHCAIAPYCRAKIAHAIGNIQSTCESRTKPVHSSALPTYSGFRIIEYGPLVISLPRRTLRVREMTPICLTAQNRRSCPAATSAAPAAVWGQGSDNGGARSSGTAGTIGSHDRLRNAHAPTRPSRAWLASAFDMASEGLILTTVRMTDEETVNVCREQVRP